MLLDALEALEQHRDGLVLVGAQAIYLYTGDADVAVATTTKDSDIAVIPARLAPEPTLDAAMTAAGFSHDRSVQQPGEWSSGKALRPSGRTARARGTPRGRRTSRRADSPALQVRGARCTRRALCSVSKPQR